MSNLIYSLNGTIPIFAVILVGYMFKRLGYVKDGFASTVNSFVFRVALPVMVFEDLWKSELKKDFEPGFVIFCFVASVVCFAIIWVGAELFIKDKTSVGAFVQSSFRSSVAVLGLAFIKMIYGDVGMAPLMIAFVVPFYNIASVVVLTFCGNDRGKTNGTAAIKKACVNIVKNPIIISIALGCIASLINLKMPVMASKTVSLIGTMATPLALIGIGADFEFRSFGNKKKLTIWGTLIKLVLQPLVVIPLAMFFGYKNQEMLAIIIMIAGPATASGYVMAKEMNNDHELSACCIVLSTLVSSVTLTFWIYVARSLGFLG